MAYRNDDDHQWDWYHTHKLYDNDKITSEFFEPVYNMIIPKIREVSEYHSLMRIKVNSYPNTKIINEHDQHSDYQFSSYGGILSLNTCNGFTRLHDGTKVDSIENRFFISRLFLLISEVLSSLTPITLLILIFFSKQKSNKSLMVHM